MGKRGSPRKLGAAGEELAKVSYRLIEADTYDDQDLLVIGGGDSAIEAALALSKSGKNRVTLSYRGDNFSRARDRNQSALAAAESEGRLKVLRKSNVVDIRPDSVKLDCAGTETVLPNHYVFILIGGESPEGFLTKIGVEIVEKAVGATPSFA
jgi:thioredoxin reductase